MAEVEVVEVAPQTVIGVRARGPYPMIGELIGRVFRYAVENKLQMAGPPIYVAHETSEEEAKKAGAEGSADLEVTLPVAGEVQGTDEIKCYELPGGKMAKILHEGAYDKASESYNELFAWLEENGMQVTGYMREVYLNDPSTVPPSGLLTEIYAPID